MINRSIKYIIQFIFFVLLQVLILNNIQYSGFINPFLYILFILWLPFDIPKPLLLVVGFVLGFVIDLFGSTLGMHTSACVFLAFCRPFVLQLIAPRDGYDLNQQPGIADFGFRWFLIYASSLTLLHHLFLFFVEVFRFSDFFYTLGRAFSSSVFTILLIIICQLFRYNSSRTT